LVVEAPPLTLGALSPGESAQAALRVRNGGSDTVRIERVETSCPCVSVNPSRATVKPGCTAELTVAFDAEHSPDFRGPLRVAVLGRGPDDRVAFQTAVDLSVESGTQD
jgi:hypothetical protein